MKHLFKFTFLFFLGIGLASCSSSSKKDGTTVEDDNNDDTNTGAKTSFVMAVGGNFSDPTGLIYSLNTGSPLTLDKVAFNGSAVDTYQDSIVRSYNKKYYVFGRDSNSAVLVFDSEKMSDGPIANYSLGEVDPNGDLDIDGSFNGTNPYEIAFQSESSAFVAFYNSNFVLEINPLTGERLQKIDISFGKTLAGITESDASAPNAVDVKLVANHLYILLQRLNSSYTALESAILVYDITQKAFLDTDLNTPEIDGIILNGKNPSKMKYLANEKSLLVAHGGNVTYAEDFSSIAETEAGTTGIEQVSVESNTTLGIVISGQDVSGTSDGFGVRSILGDTTNGLYLVYQAFDFNLNIKSFNLAQKTVSATTILPENSPAFGDLAIAKDGYLYLTNRDYLQPSIQQIDLADGQVLNDFPTELPMQSLVIAD